MTRWLVAMTVLLPACAGRLSRTDAEAHGNVSAVLASSKPALERETRAKPHPTVVLVERSGVRAIDPNTRRELWFHPLRVLGHPAASRRTLVVPIRGNRVVAIDRATGFVRWSVRLPGEALTGLTVAEPFVVAAVTGDHGKRRSRLVGLSAHDGAVRWMRKSPGRFGVPAAQGRAVFVPLDRQVLAFRTATGRELARVDVARPLQAASFSGSNAIGGADNEWVDLGAARITPSRIEDPYAEAFRTVDGIDPGLDDGERLRWWVRIPRDASPPREAVLLSRRAIVAVRLGEGGRAIRTHWLYVSKDKREFVAMHVGRRHVTLVREDGAILRLATEDGQEVDAIKGGEPVRGALLLDLQPDDKPVRLARPDEEWVVEDVRTLLSDGDPRLLPAQQLVSDVLWRDDQPEHREIVMALASGDLRRESTTAAETLRSHAVDLVARPWGESTGDSVDALLADLSVRTSFLRGEQPHALSSLARRAVKTGDRAVVPHLVAHLLHPATSAPDLAEVARALRDLGHPDAVEGVGTFVVRYHADPEVVYESGAMGHAVDYLLAVAGGPPEAALAAASARGTLDRVLMDPFTDPQLRDYIRVRLPEPPVEPASAESSDVPAPSTLAEPEDDGSRHVPALPSSGL